jgi:hypothetical protein
MRFADPVNDIGEEITTSSLPSCAGVVKVGAGCPVIWLPSLSVADKGAGRGVIATCGGDDAFWLVYGGVKDVSGDAGHRGWL